MKIIEKSLYKEILAVFLAVLLVLLIVILTTQLAKYLAWAAAGKISASSVFSILGLKLPTYLIMLVPLGMFLASILVFGRMGQDRELVVMLASGIGLDTIYKITLKLGLVLSFLLAILSFFVSPLAENKSNVLQKAGSEVGILEGLSSGKFNELPGGNQVLYAESIDTEGLMQNVFVEIETKNYRHTLKAKSGEIKTENGFTILRLFDGTRNSQNKKQPERLNFSMVDYKTHGIVLARPDKKFTSKAIDGMSTTALLGKLTDIMYLGELLWRASIPLMGLVLILLGVAFSSYKPGASKYGMLLPGVVIYFFYLSTIKTFKTETLAGNLTGGYGIIMVHTVMLGLTIWVIWRTLRPLKLNMD